MLRVLSLCLIMVVASCAANKPRTNPLSPAQADDLRIASIEIDTAKAFFGGNAEAMRGRLDADLKAKLAEQFATRMDEAGFAMTVHVQRMVIEDSGSTAFGFGRSHLHGNVVLEKADGKPVATYDIRSAAGVRGNDLLTAAVISAVQGAESFYASLVERFAATTLDRLIE